MLTWGFLLLVGGFLSCLILFLTQISDIFQNMAKLGFGYINAFFTYFDTAKLFFVIAAVLMIVGLVVYIVGLVRNKKVEGEKNTVIPAKVSKYFRDTKGEFKKIVWPSFPTVVKNTGVVLAMCAVTAVIIIGVDALCSLLIDLLLKL